MRENRNVRCAIYTRKSTEEGLDQDFNSLDAQREACEAYIRSQTHEGWKLIRHRYDDGGYSGGSMDRPGLQALMTAIQERQVGIVVVYKIDRLTRSLMDFSKIVEVFEAHGVSFVSVTQAFNTTSSMGRLTLHVLLSFAQFEREVTVERIKDKIAASKRKGLWMGGLSPLGYDVKDRRLVINEDEAATVRSLFRLYLDLGSVRELKERADSVGLKTKRRCSSSGVISGGSSFSRGHLYALLGNPIYVGRIAHRGEIYPGQHGPIVDQEIWDAVQRMLAVNRNGSGPLAAAPAAPSLLTRLVFDEMGGLSPSHAVKHGRRYRYYVSHRLMRGSSKGEGWRLPAWGLEGAVLTALAGFLRDRIRLITELSLSGLRPHQLEVNLAGADSLASKITTAPPTQQHLLLARLVRRIDLEPGNIRMRLDRSGLCAMLTDDDWNVGTARTGEAETAIIVDIPFSIRRRGVETKLVIGGTDAMVLSREPDSALLGLLAKAHQALSIMTAGEGVSVNAISSRLGLHPSDVTRILPLAFLAPDIAAAILAGYHPTALTANRLKGLCPIPADWAQQRKVLGFTHSSTGRSAD